MNQSNIQFTNPLVSVVMCTYNGGQFVEEQLETICKQSYRNLEIIIVDDCSTDNTLTILQKAAANDNRIRLFVNEINIGYQHNFNKAAGLSSGEFIAFCDQDDIWETKKIETLLSAWPEGAALIYSNSIRFEGVLDKSRCKKNNLYRRFEGNDPKKLALFNTISGHSLMIRKEFLKLVHPVPADILFDWWMGVVAASNGSVTYLDQILAYQRVHGNNVSVGGKFDHTDNAHRAALKTAVERHLLVFSESPNLSHYNQAFFKRFHFCWKYSTGKMERLRLFLFLMKHRNALFWYKKRKIGIFSHLKHSFFLSFNK